MYVSFWFQGLQPVKQCPDLSTNTYCAILRKSGELVYGVGDFNVNPKISPDYVRKHIYIHCLSHIQRYM